MFRLHASSTAQICRSCSLRAASRSIAARAVAPSTVTSRGASCPARPRVVDSGSSFSTSSGTSRSLENVRPTRTRHQELTPKWANTAIRGSKTKDDSSTSTGTAADTATSGKPQAPFSLDRVVAPVQHIKHILLGQHGIPAQESVLSALRTCEKAAGLLRNAARPPQLSVLDPQPGTSASAALLSLDGSPAAESTSRAASASTPPAPADAARDFDRKYDEAKNTISDAAFSIVSHPTVALSPQILDQYIRLQDRLGRPETLPHVLSLYASKPVPQAAEAGGPVKYVKQNPDSPSRTVGPAVAEAALEAAIAARNLDAAVGVIESTYATKAFLRSKLLQKALVPVSCAVGLPIMIYTIASGLSRLQNTMDASRATLISFVGIVAYVGFTSTIGLLATATGNDHMRRVTWAPGTSMYKRVVYEDQRAALDRVACAFGFSEPARWGEEEGEQFAALREYILRRGMILDRVELMEGLSA